MAEKLVLRFGKASDMVPWALIDEAGNRIGEIQHGALAQAGEQAAGRQVIVLVPMTDIVLLDAEVPTRKTQKLLQAVPYVLEDRVAEDIDALHFALGPRTPAGAQSVAVVARAAMDQWLAELASANLVPDVLLPESLALPVTASEWTLAVEPAQMLLALDSEKGFAIENTAAPLMLGRLLDENGATERPVQVRLLIAPGAEKAARQVADLLQQHQLDYRLEALPNALLAKLIAGLKSSRRLNLLQGQYRKSGGFEQYWRPWRAAAALAGALLVLVCVQQGLSYARYADIAAQREAHIDTLYRQIFPDARVQRDPNALRSTMQHRLSELRQADAADTGGFLTALTLLGKAMSSQSGLRLEALSYKSGVLQLNLTAPGIPALDHLKRRLADSGDFKVTIDSANASGQGVDGRLTVKQSGAPTT